MFNRLKKCELHVLIVRCKNKKCSKSKTFLVCRISATLQIVKIHYKGKNLIQHRRKLKKKIIILVIVQKK